MKDNKDHRPQIYMAAILMGVLLGIVCFVVFTGYDRMKIEKIADETLDFMQDRVKNMMTTK